jgi:translocator protein
VTRERTTTRTLIKTSAAVSTAAGIGALATDPASGWYRDLRKPSWQPPGAVYGLVWTPLYGMIAYAAGRAIDRAGDDRRAVVRELAVNLALNTAWPCLFFGVRSPRAALAAITLLDVSNVRLVRRAWRADRRAGLLLVPYVGWTAFATALNAAIAGRNR